MEALTAAAFESRASEAEARLAVLEAKLLSGVLAGKWWLAHSCLHAAVCCREGDLAAPWWSVLFCHAECRREHALHGAGVSGGGHGNAEELTALRDLLVKAREETVKLQGERDVVRRL
jgi:hypothetical protein